MSPDDRRVLPERPRRAAQGDVAFSDEKIVVPWVLHPDVLVVMAQDVVKVHAPAMPPGSNVIADDIMVTDVSPFPKGVAIYHAPMIKHELLFRLVDMPKPVIAAVDGPAFGAGATWH